MNIRTPLKSEIIQYSWVVPSIESAAQVWYDRLGVGPFTLMRDVQVDNPTYRGGIGEASFSVALAMNGSVLPSSSNSIAVRTCRSAAPVAAAIDRTAWSRSKQLNVALFISIIHKYFDTLGSIKLRSQLMHPRLLDRGFPLGNAVLIGDLAAELPEQRWGHNLVQQRRTE